MIPNYEYLIETCISTSKTQFLIITHSPIPLRKLKRSSFLVPT